MECKAEHTPCIISS